MRDADPRVLTVPGDQKWLAPLVAETLAAHISEFAPAEDGSLFTTTSGNLYRQEHFGVRVSNPAVESAGLPAGVTSHDLRHHYASVLLAAGESVIAVAERLDGAEGRH